MLSRRDFCKTSLTALGADWLTSTSFAGTKEVSGPIIDTHMHVWGNDSKRYPFPHPYIENYAGPEHEGTMEMLLEDMDAHGCTHAVLVQVIFHGWDNTYIADAARRYPKRLKAHGLIDPTDPKVADKLEYWVREQGLAGMRFSPIYYLNGAHGGDGWLDADETHTVWKKAAALDAVFNYFIAPEQLPRLARMAAAHPDVRIIVDHLGHVNLTKPDPEGDLQKLLALAKLPNVWVKVSELSSMSPKGSYPFAETYPYVNRVYESFGPDRLLFGTGYPGSARAAYHRPTLRQEIDLIGAGLPFLSPDDRAKILGNNAAKLWGFQTRT